MGNKIVGQQTLASEVHKIFNIFKNSDCAIRPHFILTGPSGSGKTHTIKVMAEYHKLGFLEINAAALTKEGTSGNSLSKALTPLLHMGNRPVICFVDEFDKLFISGNSNSSLAHETTNGVQNEFLKVLEADEASVYHDFGKYAMASVKNVLFVFGGAFNNEPNISITRLQELGIKTEFLGRVGLIYNAEKLALESLYEILENSDLLDKYMQLFVGVKRETVIDTIKKYLAENYEDNTLGARSIHTLINQYFIKGGKLGEEDVKKSTIQKKMSLTEGTPSPTPNN